MPFEREKALRSLCSTFKDLSHTTCVSTGKTSEGPVKNGWDGAIVFGHRCGLGQSRTEGKRAPCARKGLEDWKRARSQHEQIPMLEEGCGDD